MLKIISNNKLLNHNTNYTNLAMEIAEDLINQYLYNLYTEQVRCNKNSVTSQSIESSESGVKVDNLNQVFNRIAPRLIDKNDNINISIAEVVTLKEQSEGDIYNSNYTFSMFKLENKNLVEKFNDIELVFNIGSYLFNILKDLELIKIVPFHLKKDESKQIVILGKQLENIESKNILGDLSYKIPMLIPPKK